MEESTVGYFSLVWTKCVNDIQPVGSFSVSWPFQDKICLYTSGSGASFGVSSDWALIIDFRVPSSNWGTGATSFNQNKYITHTLAWFQQCTNRHLKSVELILQHEFNFEKSLLFLFEFLKATQHSWWVCLQHYCTQNHNKTAIIMTS